MQDFGATLNRKKSGVSMIRKLDLLPIFAIAMSRAENVLHVRMLGMIFLWQKKHGQTNIYRV